MKQPVPTKVKTVFHRKVRFLEELEEFKPTKLKWHNIDHVITLTNSKHNYFMNNLLEGYSWLAGKEGVILVTDEDMENGIAVTTEGYSYARYSGLAYEVQFETVLNNDK